MKQATKFRVYINKKFDGPFDVPELFKLPGFSLKTPVMPDGGDAWWEPAEQYPIITQFLRQETSGDYKPELITAEELSKAPDGNWRQAVIGQDIPEVKSYSAPSVDPSGDPSMATKSQLPAPPSPSPIPKTKEVSKASARHRQGMLLLLLGLSFAELYIPQTDNLENFLGRLSPEDSAITSMGYRFKTGGIPHAGERTKPKGRLKNSSVTAASSNSSNLSNVQVEEIGSEDMGNGFISKTIVTSEVRDGVRTQRTTTVTVPSHPLKTKKAKVRKPRPVS